MSFLAPDHRTKGRVQKNSNRMQRGRFKAVAAAAGIVLPSLFVVGRAGAQTSTWTSAVNGTFSDATKWTGGVPGSSSTAVFNATTSPYTVTFTNSPTNAGLSVSNGTVSFALGGNTYILTATSSL